MCAAAGHAAAKGSLIAATTPPLLHHAQPCRFGCNSMNPLNRVAAVLSHLQWAAGASRQNLEELARWAPEMALAAGTVPPLKASWCMKVRHTMSVAWQPACLAIDADASLSTTAVSVFAALWARHSLPLLSSWFTLASSFSVQAPMALCLVAFVTGLAAQVRIQTDWHLQMY